MLAKRLTYREIAENLSISPETVKSHGANIYRKLKVSGRRQAIDPGKKYIWLEKKPFSPSSRQIIFLNNPE